jgi:BirA family biotin operon repressor/biotin-[acetyl-CoA-carboxylase] ligase
VSFDGTYADPARPPLRSAGLAAALTPPVGWWREVRVVAESTSTNADVAAQARAGAAEGLVVVAEAQTAGRGRRGRAWVAPPRAGLTFSVLLRPGPAVVPQRWGWLPLLTGVALAEAITRLAAVPVRLKWPNDLLVGAPDGDAKCAGILAESIGEAVVVGVGLNVTTRRSELPVPEATSLALAGAACTDRETLLRGVLGALARRYTSWREVAGNPEACGLAAGYRRRCATLGRRVRVTLPDGSERTGVADDVDADGRLVVDGVPLLAGDVVHVRPPAGGVSAR